MTKVKTRIKTLEEKGSGGALRAQRAARFEHGERYAPIGADSKTWFYRYNLVFRPLQVFLAGKLDEKVSEVSLRVGRISHSERGISAHSFGWHLPTRSSGTYALARVAPAHLSCINFLGAMGSFPYKSIFDLLVFFKFCTVYVGL